MALPQIAFLGLITGRKKSHLHLKSVIIFVVFSFPRSYILCINILLCHWLLETKPILFWLILFFFLNFCAYSSLCLHSHFFLFRSSLCLLYICCETKDDKVVYISVWFIDKDLNDNMIKQTKPEKKNKKNRGRLDALNERVAINSSDDMCVYQRCHQHAWISVGRLL